LVLAGKLFSLLQLVFVPSPQSLEFRVTLIELRFFP
jgi:hypothetical protein